MHLRMLLLLLLMSPISTDLFAATRYVAQNGSDSNSCLESETITTPKLTFASAVGCVTAGDTLFIRGGTWTERIDLQIGNKTGTASAPIVIAGYPGETVTIRYTDSVVAGYGPIKARGARGYFIFRDLILDGSTSADEVKWQIRDGNHHFILDRIEMTGFPTSALYVSANDITIRNCKLHDTSGPQNVGYGIYWHDGDNGLVEGCEIYNQPGGGIQAYPGPMNNVTFRRNHIHDNNSNPTKAIGGIIVANEPAASPVQAVSNVSVYDNWFVNNGSHASAGAASGVRVDGTALVSNIKVFNNVMYGNKTQGFRSTGPTTGLELRNNIITNNGTVTALGNFTASHNACLSGETCGATNKITLASSIACFVSSSDFRLQPGTNVCRNAGTAVSTRASPIGVTDIGATEQGLVASAVVASGYIEVTVNVMTAPVLPGVGCTGTTIANGTSTGTPIVTDCVVKAGASNVLQLTVSGFTGSGTCTLSYSGGNVTDSGYVGPVSGGLAQGINSASGVSVSGTCDNTAGGSPPASGLYSVFALDEGSGTTATDSSGNANHGTVSAGVTWVSDTSGTGVSIPTDATFRHVASTYGQGIDIEETSVSVCALVLPDLQHSQKVVVSAGGNGSSQRFYFGWATVGGVQQWGSGVGASGFTSGATEFPASPQLTLVCLRANAATDTATLSVNRTIGTSAAAVKSTVGFTTLVDDLRAGNDGTFTTNNGGYTVYGMWVWENTYLADSDVQDLYDTLFATGGAVGGYAQKAHRWQGVYLDGNGDPVTIGTASTLEVVQGGAVALEMQVDCTGGACDPVALRLYVSDIAGNTTAVPQSIGAFGVGMWGASTSAILNRNVSSCCITGALTANDGVTLLDAVATNTIELAQDSSVMFRWIVTIGQNAPVDEELFFFPKQDNGAELDGAAGTVPTIRVIAPQASGGF